MTGLADFLVIGAMRAGTTTLYDLLRAHPEIDMAREKETDFLIAERGWSRGRGWYEGQFAQDGRLRGEVSPNYTKAELFPGVPERAAALMPEARLVFVHRDPVARVASHYAHARLMRRPVPGPGDMAGSAALAHMIDVSRYARQVGAWQAVYPADRFLFLEFDDLVSAPAVALARLARFLGVADRWPEVPVANSEAALARLPLWLLGARQSAVGRGARRVLSAEARGRLKSAVSRPFAGRTIDTVLPEAVLAEVAAALEEDRAAFAEMLATAASEGRR